MPIAHCLVSKFCQPSESSLVDLWTKHSGVSASEMTINISQVDHQQGKSYDIISSLYLPSCWEKASITKLQIGLSNALSEYYGLDQSNILILTSVIESGNLVEQGKEQQW